MSLLEVARKGAEAQKTHVASGARACAWLDADRPRPGQCVKMPERDRIALWRASVRRSEARLSSESKIGNEGGCHFMHRTRGSLRLLTNAPAGESRQGGRLDHDS